jgi:hypothetical protein
LELILLLFFGIVSPFCAVALWASAASGILLLRLQIYRYYLLQSENASKIDSVVVFDKDHIEVMCGSALKYSHIFIQPILLLSLIFGLYLFEMAYDGKKGSVAVSISLLILLSCTTFIVQNLILWSRQDRPVVTQRNTKALLELGTDFSDEKKVIELASGFADKKKNEVEIAPGISAKKNVDLELLEVYFSEGKNDTSSVKSPLYDHSIDKVNENKDFS